MPRRRGVAPCASELSACAGYRFLPEVILLTVSRYLRFGLSCRDFEKRAAEPAIDVDHVTLYRWVGTVALSGNTFISGALWAATRLLKRPEI